ncbi:MAG: glycosyltransferase family 2 protein [Thermoleophilaceae bacterium]
MISVVVPTYNRASVLDRCLIALQNEPADEVVVVDDGSTDDTMAVLRRHDWVRSTHRENGGRSAAKNTGVEMARGDLVLFLDDDVIAVPGLVDRHVRHHFIHPEAHEALLGRVTWSPQVTITRHMRWLERGGPMFAYDRIEDRDDVDWRHLYTSNVSMKKEFLEPFDTDLAIFEDTELGYRLSKRGLRLRYDQEALAYHLREETPERTERRMEQVGAAAALLHEKWPELREPPPRMRRIGRLKAAAAGALSRAGVRAFDDRLDDWRAARAFAVGYERAAAPSR